MIVFQVKIKRLRRWGLVWARNPRSWGFPIATRGSCPTSAVLGHRTRILHESQRRYLPRAGLNPRSVLAAGIALWICPPEVFELRVCVVLAQIGMNSTRARSPVWNASPTVVFILLTFGLLSKQSSLQMVGERRHSTIMLVGYKSLFLSEVSKLLRTRSTICFL